MFFFFFKQKTAYEMRISDWSSDVCSSDLLEAMLSKDPTPDEVEGNEDGGDGEISAKTAGPSFKEDDEEEEEPAAQTDADDENYTERRTPRPVEEEEEDNSLSLAAMEELLKPDALERFAANTEAYTKLPKQTARA